jgi:hypothetical protein
MVSVAGWSETFFGSWEFEVEMGEMEEWRMVEVEIGVLGKRSQKVYMLWQMESRRLTSTA